MHPENKLFATLDVTAHPGKLPSGMTVLFLDTVGFVSDLPPQLVESFSATLEDITESVSTWKRTDGLALSFSKKVVTNWPLPFLPSSTSIILMHKKSVCSFFSFLCRHKNSPLCQS